MEIYNLKLGSNPTKNQLGYLVNILSEKCREEHHTKNILLITVSDIADMLRGTEYEGKVSEMINVNMGEILNSEAHSILNKITNS